MNNEQKIHDLLQKGSGITKADYEEIQFLLTQIPWQNWEGMSRIVSETVGLIIRDARYAGDLTWEIFSSYDVEDEDAELDD